MKKISVILAMSFILFMTSCSSVPTVLEQKPDNDIKEGSFVVNNQPESSIIYIEEKPATNDTLVGEKPSSVESEKASGTSSEKPSSVESEKASATSSQKSSFVKSEKASATSSQKPTKPVSTSNQVDEKRAVWLSYLEFQTILTGKTEKEFTKSIETAFTNSKNFGLNTVFVQVRPFGDAIYPSKLFPWSHIATGKEGQALNYDPLAIMVDIAHKKGLKIEAWINPFRVRTANSNKPMSAENWAQKWIASGSRGAVEIEEGIYYNPASAQARKLIVDGVVEIINNYEVDGIHFDDYFYPSKNKDFDAKDFDDYKQQGGKLAFADWRRENVNILVRDVYSAIKNTDSNVVFGISPQANMENNYNDQFIDVQKWLSQTGYVDYICPQIYYGFQNETYPYAYTVKLWNELIKVDGIDLYVGLSPYKIGTEDKWAGSGKNEWFATTDILKRMVLEARTASNYAGFSLYRYDSIFTPSSSNTIHTQMKTEKENLQTILK